jgi:hypothetical protein
LRREGIAQHVDLSRQRERGLAWTRCQRS